MFGIPFGTCQPINSKWSVRNSIRHSLELSKTMPPLGLSVLLDEIIWREDIKFILMTSGQNIKTKTVKAEYNLNKLTKILFIESK